MSQSVHTPQAPPQPPPARPSPSWYRRALLIVPLVLLVGAAAAVGGVLVAQPTSVTVTGKVVDRLRPDQPVASAIVAADGKAITTDLNGAFRLTGVAKHATLTVRARNYTDSVITTPTMPMTVQLAPIPIKAKVTSAMTGRPLTARFAASTGRALDAVTVANGVVRIYRVGPGDTLTITADGYLDATAAVAADRTLTVALQPTRRTMWRQLHRWIDARRYPMVTDWVLRLATGYDFRPATPQEQAGLNKLAGPMELYYTGRDVLGTTAWVEFTIDKPDVVFDVRGAVKAMLGRASGVILAEQSAWHGGPDADGVYGTVYTTDVLDIEVFGESLAETDRIMTGILRALVGSTGAA
jgi:hypothetical protein